MKNYTLSQRIELKRQRDTEKERENKAKNKIVFGIFGLFAIIVTLFEISG
jgi:hypothetical protein